MDWSKVADVLAVAAPIVALAAALRIAWLYGEHRITGGQIIRGGSKTLLTTSLAFIALNSLTPNAPPVLQAPEGIVTFAAFGDAPYSFDEEVKYELVLDDIAGHGLDAVLHVGDFLAGSCTDTAFQKRLDQFENLPHPLIYTPGDNEWTDCWRSSRHVFPLERLDALRTTFFPDPESSLGQRKMSVVSQASRPGFERYVENAMWRIEDVLFATFHMVGSANAAMDHPRRSRADDDEVAERTAAAVEWMNSTFASAEASGVGAVVLAFHGSPAFETPESDPQRQAFAPFVEALSAGASAFDGPVLAIHGDWHDFIVDRPLPDTPNLTRMQVPGSSLIGWVHVTVDPTAADPFSFTQRLVPFWKFW